MMVHDATYLADNYSPPKDVAVLGRGKRYIKHEGNRRLRELVQKELPAYLAAFNRKNKSAIILRVLETMRHNSKDNIGLVRYDTLTSKWSLVDDGTARVSIAQLFRDALAVYYKSSSQHKRKLRRESKTKKLRRTVSQESSSSSSSSSKDDSDEEEAEEDNRSSTKAARQQKMSLASLGPTPFTGAFAKARLSSVLQNANRMLESVDEESSAVAAPEAPQGQLFDSLFSAFLADSDNMDVNPFEPTPIAESVPGPVLIEPTPIHEVSMDKAASNDTIRLQDFFYLQQGESFQAAV